MVKIQEGGNFSNGKIPPQADVYRHCNFAFDSPQNKDGKKVGHIIFPNNIKSLIFYRCNMRNCIPPENAILTKCITPIIETFKSVSINGKECEGHRLYGVTNQVTKEAEYRTDPKDMFFTKTDFLVSTPDKIADGSIPLLPSKEIP